MKNPISCLVAFCALFLINKSTLPQLYHYINGNKSGVTLQILRKLEKLGLKVRKLHLDVKYLQSCLELDLVPATLKIDNERLKHFGNTRRLHQSFVKERLLTVQEELKSRNTVYAQEREQIYKRLSLVERTCLQSLLNKHYVTELEKVKSVHAKKLLNLWNKEGKKSPDCIVNSSNRKLTAHEMDALQYGLKHHVLPKSFEHEKIKINIERMMNDVTWRNGSKVDFK